MATKMIRKNLKGMLVLGFGVLLLVEFFKIVVLIEDYDSSNEAHQVEDKIGGRAGGNLVQLAVEETKKQQSLMFRSRWSKALDSDLEEANAKFPLGLDKNSEKGERKADGDSAERLEIRELNFLEKLLHSNESRNEVKIIKRFKNYKRTEDKRNNNFDSQKEKKITGKQDHIKTLSSKQSLNEIKNISSDDPGEIYINSSRPILNPHPFRYLLNSPDMCKGEKIFLLCYVHTAVKHYKHRKRIRQTWGNRTNYPGVEIRIVFFVGLPQLNTSDGRLDQEYLNFESRRYGDIVQEDFLDTYKNLSHKGIGALRWITDYCNSTDYVLKTDDDMFVNMYVILNHLRNLHRENFRRRLMMCYVFWRMHVDRKGGQWSLSRDYFPDDIYPPYCSGMGYVASVDVAIAMYRVSPYVRFLWVDDAFISGVLPAALQGAVNHTSWGRTYCAAYEMGVYTHPTEWYKYTFSQVHDEALNLRTWKGLSDIVRNRTIPLPSVIKPGHLADEYIPLFKLYPPSNAF